MTRTLNQIQRDLDKELGWKDEGRPKKQRKLMDKNSILVAVAAAVAGFLVSIVIAVLYLNCDHNYTAVHRIIWDRGKVGAIEECSVCNQRRAMIYGDPYYRTGYGDYDVEPQWLYSLIDAEQTVGLSDVHLVMFDRKLVTRN